MLGINSCSFELPGCPIGERSWLVAAIRRLDWIADRSARPVIPLDGSVWSRAVQSNTQRFERNGPSLFPFGGLVTVLQSAARGAAECKGKI